MSLSRILTFVAALLLFSPELAAAQTLNPRFGLSFNTMLSSADGFGVGVRGRASAPVNADLSVAADLGLTGFVLGGWRNADYIFDPQLSAILSMPESPASLTYVLFGLGAYAPVGGDDENPTSGPTIHLGVGWVRALQESSFFYEINPALIIGAESIDVAVPVRIGVIF